MMSHLFSTNLSRYLRKQDAFTKQVTFVFPCKISRNNRNQNKAKTVKKRSDVEIFGDKT